MQSPLSVLVVMACCGALAAFPGRARRSLPLPDGVPLELLFAACGDTSDQTDIGPCVEELLSGVIEMATPSFATGLEVGGKTVVLEPLAIKDIMPKDRSDQKKFKIWARNITVAGLSTVQVEGVTLLPNQLALNLGFSALNVSGDMTLRYRFLSARPQLELALYRPSFNVTADWSLRSVDGDLAISFSNVDVTIDIESFSAEITGLSGLGEFLRTIINNNNAILLGIFIPQLEQEVKGLLERKLDTFRLSSM